MASKRGILSMDMDHLRALLDLPEGVELYEIRYDIRRDRVDLLLQGDDLDVSPVSDAEVAPYLDYRIKVEEVPPGSENYEYTLIVPVVGEDDG